MDPEVEYRSFSPTEITVQWMVDDPEIHQLLSEADRYIGRLDAFSDLIPDVGFFIKMHITKEATVSSKIEGTQTTFQEALIKEEDLNPEKRDDWKEVHSYIDPSLFGWKWKDRETAHNPIFDRQGATSKTDFILI